MIELAPNTVQNSFDDNCAFCFSPSNQSTGINSSSTIQVQFSKFMNRLTISASNFTLTYGGSTVVSGTISVTADGTNAVFTPSAPLAPSTVFSITVGTGVLDVTGPPLTAFHSSFTTK